MDALLDGKRAVCRKCGALDWECLHRRAQWSRPTGFYWDCLHRRDMDAARYRSVN